MNERVNEQKHIAHCYPGNRSDNRKQTLIRLFRKAYYMTY